MNRSGLIAAAVIAFAAAAAPAAETAQPTSMPAGASDWPQKSFVHPPLKCMRLYTRIDEYPVIAWCFHGRGAPGYNEEFVKQAQACGFNVLLDAAIMLKPVEQFEGMKVLAVVFRFPPERITKEVFEKFGDHPRLLGFVLDDNCPRIYGWSIKASNWLRGNYPHLVPWISENPDPTGQSRTAMRILGTQNYWYTRSPGPWGRQAFVSTLGRDRDKGNALNMSFWPLISTPTSPAGVRFQALAAAAHGAQGVCYFAYCPGDRWPQWKHPQGDVAQAAAHANTYLTKVAGKYIWGTRCMGVLHAPRDGDVPRNAGRAGQGQIIEDMDKEVLAGLLLPEKEFLEPAPKDGKKLPLYAFVVDKRFGGPKRTIHVNFSGDVKLVEVFERPTGTDRDKLRIIEPACSVPLELLAGDGRLLRLNPDGIDKLFGPDGGKYLTAVNAVTDLHRKAREGKTAPSELGPAADGIRRSISDLNQATDRMDDKALAGQRRDMLKRIAAAIDQAQAAGAASAPH